MLFNTYDFLFFFLVVYVAFLAIPRYRWVILLAGSYYFYMSWKWEYIILIVFSTTVDFFSAKLIEESPDNRRKKKFLWISLVANLGLLFLFKYFEFFANSVTSLISKGTQVELAFVLPVGISFYTFQTMSYTIDVYKGRQKAEKHLGHFALFVTFFPQLVAGPIERAGNLMDQLKNKLAFKQENLLPALRLFLWGLFKKVVIADRIAMVVDEVFGKSESYGTVMHWFAAFLFAIQIYCDFSGYSDMAIGIARSFNVRLMTNFKAPYFAVNITDFWRRWHISLSQWFRDYVYIPLGGNRVVKWRWYYNLFITFAISGLWHGANWTFVVWGALHGTFLVLERVLPKILNYKLIRIPWTFLLVLIGWVFFRADSVQEAWEFLTHMGKLPSGLSSFSQELVASGTSKLNFLIAVFAIGILLFKDAREWNVPWVLRTCFYVFITFMIIVFAMDNDAPFIYFQF